MEGEVDKDFAKNKDSIFLSKKRERDEANDIRNRFDFIVLKLFSIIFHKLSLF